MYRTRPNYGLRSYACHFSLGFIDIWAQEPPIYTSDSFDITAPLNGYPGPLRDSLNR